MFVLQGQKPVYLLCYEAVLVNKEYNLSRHFDTKHAKVSLSGKQNILQELKGILRLQQNVLTKGTTQNTAAVKAAFVVAEEITWASKSLADGAFLKHAC